LVNILYAEKSFRPMPTELTYVPRAPLREYDYYIVLSTDGLVFPMYLEDLTYPWEYGGKTAVDRQAGVAAPVQFIVGDGECVPRRPSLSSWTNPVSVGGVIGEVLCSEAERLSRYSLYLQAIARDFWEELVEAQLFYAPSIYYQYLSEPLRGLVDRIMREDLYCSDVEKYFWNVMKWRTIVDKYVYTGCVEDCNDIYTAIHSCMPEKDFDTYWRAQESLFINLDLSGCNRVNVIIPLFNIDDVSRRARELGLELHPALATLTTPILHILYKIMNSNNQHIEFPLTVTIIHDYPSNKRGSELTFCMIKKLGEYVSKMINSIKGCEPETLLNPLVDEGLRKLGAEVFHTPDHLIYVIGLGLDEIGHGKQRRLRGVDKEYLEEVFNRIAGIAPINIFANDVCSIIVVRDVAKSFLSLLIDYTMEHTKRVYLTYAPEAITIYVKGFIKCYAKKDIKDIMPTVKIPLYFYRLLNDKRINELFGNFKINYKEKCSAKPLSYKDILNISRWKCLVRSSYVSFLEVSMKIQDH